MNSMYEKLMGLPIFAGASHQKLCDLVGKHPFHFLKYAPGETIVNKGDPCTHLKSIITGQVRMTVTNADSRFSVSQTLSAPDVICPDFFFGKTTRYPASATAISDTGIMQIDKNDYLKIINSDPVFLFNYLNILSLNAQLSVEGVLALTSGSIEKRIAYWVIALTQKNGTDITLECRQRDLYAVFGVPRQSLLAALDSMQERGLISYTTRAIRINDRRSLLSSLSD
ncbi:MAG: Crp/Fnr family transcriptional regulator [Muribaculaceae bacterium]|nr:Crp/Fnr family transcriptional regulator [Muribaculaceae bacterium]